jgi:flavin reductase (DIM6/NTAB) family NADH-FMN oxidoreductase RutF
MECRHLRTLELPSDNPDQHNHVVFGEVIGIHIDERVLIDGRVDVATIAPIARLGYMDYAVVEKIFTMNRPDYS